MEEVVDSLFWAVELVVESRHMLHSESGNWPVRPLFARSEVVMWVSAKNF